MKNYLDELLDKLLVYLKIFFGKRIVKTGVATSLSLWISTLLGLRMNSMVALAVITTMRSSIFESWYDSVNRMYSTLIGVLLGSLFQYLGWTGYFYITLGIIIIINITNYFKWNDATNLALMVFVIVIIYTPSYAPGHPDYMNYVQYSINRAQDTLIGLGIGFAVNYLVFPPKKEEIFLRIYKKARKEIDLVLHQFLEGKTPDLNDLIDNIETMASELPYTREHVIGKDIDMKTSELAKINATFTSAFGLVSKFVEDEKIPELSEENLRSIYNYFGKDIILEIDETDIEYKTAFNYYFDDLMDKLNRIDNIINNLEEQISK